MNITQNSSFSRTGKNALYQTANSEYGSPWVQDNTRPELNHIKISTVPTYAQIVASINDFKKSERLIKNKLVQQKLRQVGIDLNAQNQKFMKKTQFPIKSPEKYKYPEHGLNLGSAIYRTNNMNYGAKKPAEFELQNKYFPSNHTFTKSFCGGNYRFNGLNTVKDVSNVHDALKQF